MYDSQNGHFTLSEMGRGCFQNFLIVFYNKR